MSDIQHFLEACFSGPTLPATLLLLLVVFYWLLVLVGLSDLDMFDSDFDLDMDGQGESLSVGFVALRMLNLGSVPLALWGSVFALCLWTLSISIDGGARYDSVWMSALALARSAGISLFLTKVLTQPLRGRFDPAEPNAPETLIGRRCVVTSSEVSPSFGQARVDTEAAPLQLHARTAEGTLLRGVEAEIVAYDPVNSIYVVRSADVERSADA